MQRVTTDQKILPENGQVEAVHPQQPPRRASLWDLII